MSQKHAPKHLTVIEFANFHCGQCGGHYALDKHVSDTHYQNGTSWNCPYCQVGWGYTGNPETKRLKKELADKQQTLDQARRQVTEARWDTQQAKLDTKHAKNQTRAQKAAKTRLKNAFAAGKCPCCRRTFVDLFVHMNKRHPEYVHQPDEAD